MGVPEKKDVPPPAYTYPPKSHAVFKYSDLKPAFRDCHPFTRPVLEKVVGESSKERKDGMELTVTEKFERIFELPRNVVIEFNPDETMSTSDVAPEFSVYLCHSGRPKKEAIVHHKKAKELVEYKLKHGNPPTRDSDTIHWQSESGDTYHPGVLHHTLSFMDTWPKSTQNVVKPLAIQCPFMYSFRKGSEVYAPPRLLPFENGFVKHTANLHKPDGSVVEAVIRDIWQFRHWDLKDVTDNVGDRFRADFKASHEFQIGMEFFPVSGKGTVSDTMKRIFGR